MSVLCYEYITTGDKGSLEKIKPNSKAKKWEKASTNSASLDLDIHYIMHRHLFYFEQQLEDAVNLYLSKQDG